MKSGTSYRLVMPGLVPGIHVFMAIAAKQDVDGRDKPGHDEKLFDQVLRMRISYLLNRATSSTCGVWRNWSTGVTPSIV